MKKVGVFLFALAAVLSSQADVLYWQVASSVQTAGGATYKLGEDYAYARLLSGSSEDDATAVTTYVLSSGNSVSGQGQYVDLVSADGATLAGVLGDSYTSQNFWVELYSSTGAWLARSGNVSGSNLSDYVHTPSDFLPSTVSQSVLTFGGTYQTLPEPTSGVLLLIGAGLLGLRRRKQV